MHYAESREQAEQYAAAAIERLRALRVPLTPQNYTIWYNAHSGRYPGLTRRLEELDARNEKFTPEICASLYARFFTYDSEGAALCETSSRIEASVNAVLDMLGQAGQDASDYGEVLAGLSGSLDMDAAGEQVRQVVAGLLSETRKMEEQSRQVQDRLAKSTREIEDLREDLEVVRREAMTDPLTGAANRKFFDSRLRELADEAMISNQPMALLMLDIDYFKRFNDQFGHQLGDEVLKLVAECLIRAIKGRDLAARYGGEEFSIILPDTGLAGATVVAQQICETVAKKQIVRKSTGESLASITLSIGAAEFRRGEALQNLIGRADMALYAAKDGGRNRVYTEAQAAASPPQAAAS